MTRSIAGLTEVRETVCGRLKMSSGRNLSCEGVGSMMAVDGGGSQTGRRLPFSRRINRGLRRVKGEWIWGQ